MSMYMYKKCNKLPLTRQILHEVTKDTSTTITDKRVFISTVPCFNITAVPEEDRYVELGFGKYSGSVGKMTKVYGKKIKSKPTNPFSLRVEFKDGSYGIYDYDTIIFNADPKKFSNKNESPELELPEISVPNHFNQTVEKDVYAMIFSRSDSRLLYAKITSVTPNRIDYVTPDGSKKFIQSRYSVFVFPDQEDAKKRFALESLRK